MHIANELSGNDDAAVDGAKEVDGIAQLSVASFIGNVENAFELSVNHPVSAGKIKRSAVASTMAAGLCKVRGGREPTACGSEARYIPCRGASPVHKDPDSVPLAGPITDGEWLSLEKDRHK
jgi:hypothetical protein